MKNPDNFIFIFLLLFKYSCLHFPLITPSHRTLHPTPQSYPSLALSMGPLYMFLDDSSPFCLHYCPSPFPLVTVSLFFISMSLVIFRLLVLLIMFQLKVRSYGICPSPPGLFHLAWCFPVPSMLLWRVGVPSFFVLGIIPLCKCITVFWSTLLVVGT